MNDAVQRKLKSATDCALRFDNLSRQLYATDGSLYQIVPWGVALPRTAAEAAAVMQAAAAEDVPLIPRGGGTGLAGGALGEGLVLDLARHNTAITDLKPEARTVRVGAGVTLDRLNQFLKPHGFCFGPDVATSSRATLGGMIGNNSSGARTPFYGVTIDHVHRVELILPDGRVAEVGLDRDGFADECSRSDAMIRAKEAVIREQFHPDIIKRWPGFGLDRYLRDNGNFARVVGGSEGTLGSVFSAELNIEPLPKEKGLALFFFDTVAEAMQATVELLESKPAAIEHIDDVVFDQTRGQRAFKEARDLLELDDKPCKSILVVEVFDHVADKLAALKQKDLGLRHMICTDSHEMELVWAVRKAGLTLLTSRKGDAKPVSGIEDVAVPPSKLPDYVNGLAELMEPLGLKGSFYGHAASGLLHVRPVVDMHSADEIEKFRQLADGVSDLTRRFNGSLAAEHGVGKARAEYMEEHLGELLGTMREIKGVFDPKGVMNPGTLFPDARWKIDRDLRWGPDYKIPIPFEPVLAFSERDESFVRNLEQCNGNGACRKLEPTMCPTYIATGEEIMSTRGRANAIRASLDGRVDTDAPLAAHEMNEALKYCLSCKACKTECPSNVDMALQKAELLHARNRKHGLSLTARLLSRADLLGAMGTLAPGLANWSLRLKPVRKLMQAVGGLHADAFVPPFADERFDAWFQSRNGNGRGDAGSVILWDDTFVRHHEPRIGKAAVAVLEAAGFDVELPRGRACCGRPAFSLGRLDVAAELGRHNLDLLRRSEAPIVFLEPSCYSMFIDDYKELGLDGAEAVEQRCYLFEQFIEKTLVERPDALNFDETKRSVAIHAHCHAKALTKTQVMPSLAGRMPNTEATLLRTACCGMAGSYGVKAETYDVSQQLGGMLRDTLQRDAKDACVVASGTSCRHQIEHMTGERALHMAELLAGALAEAAGKQA